MEQPAFDGIARALASGASRRAGVRTAVAAVVGALAGRAAITEAAPGKDGKAARSGKGGTLGGRMPASEKRPCGPKASENRCTRHKDCCTNYCQPGRKGKPGRCRCIKPGKACANGQTCCGSAVCRNRTCQPRCTVCASGCAHTTVNAAYAAAAPGGVITIDSGTYPTEILVTKDITLRACNGATDVVLIPSRTTVINEDSYACYVVVGENPLDAATKHAVTLEGLRFTGNAGADDEELIYSYTNGTVSWTVRGCTVSGAQFGIDALNGVHVIENSTFSGCEFGPYFKADAPGASVTLTGCTMRDNDTAGVLSTGGAARLNGCLVTGSRGGGIQLVDGAMTLADTTVTGNVD
ncbi:MAG: right-handed parallel beta-helix repeat-containing protein, partial [Chloroflexota bacterium]